MLADASEQPLTADEVAFEARAKADGERIDRFRQSLSPGDDPAGPANPEHGLAREYFAVYLATRPSRLASRALGLAFRMWGHLKGSSAQVRAVVAQIPCDEDVWGDQAVDGALGAFWEDHGFAAALTELEQLLTPVQ